MKKLDYDDEKIVEIVDTFTDLKFQVLKLADSIDIQLKTRADYSMVQHELYKIFGYYPRPPMAFQLDESSLIVSVFDTRQR